MIDVTEAAGQMINAASVVDQMEEKIQVIVIFVEILIDQMELLVHKQIEEIVHEVPIIQDADVEIIVWKMH